MKKVLVIAGPTGVGKTALSIALAEKYHGEIISGDSIQVYKGLDIGSAKITEEEMQGVPHYCIDILENKDAYSVFDFQKNARHYIDVIEQKDKLPMIVGGTGLYIKAALYDYQFEEHETVDQKLIDKKYEQYNNEQLFALLQQKDYNTALTIHPNNRKRVIRALEIAANSNQNKSENLANQKHEMIYDALILGLTMDRTQLYERIDYRVELMMNAGLEDEMRRLLSEGVTFDDRSMQGIGYREWRDFFDGNKTKDEVKENIQKNSRQFAKRQYTWLNNQFKMNWIDVKKEDAYEKACALIDEWLDK